MEACTSKVVGGPVGFAFALSIAFARNPPDMELLLLLLPLLLLLVLMLAVGLESSRSISLRSDMRAVGSAKRESNDDLGMVGVFLLVFVLVFVLVFSNLSTNSSMKVVIGE